MRLFIAIEIPDEQKWRMGKLRSEIPGARWVPAGQIHLTLAFLGEVDEESTARLIIELGKIQASPFNLTFSEAGCFPDRHHPRVLWAGLRQEPALTRLAAAINSVVRGSGIPLDERPFSPHITLARLKLPCAREVGEFLQCHRRVAIDPFFVREFILFQSRLSQKGALHLPVRSFPLAASELNC